MALDFDDALQWDVLLHDDDEVGAIAAATAAGGATDVDDGGAFAVGGVGAADDLASSFWFGGVGAGDATATGAGAEAATAAAAASSVFAEGHDTCMDDGSPETPTSLSLMDVNAALGSIGMAGSGGTSDIIQTAALRPMWASQLVKAEPGAAPAAKTDTLSLPPAADGLPSCDAILPVPVHTSSSLDAAAAAAASAAMAAATPSASSAKRGKPKVARKATKSSSSSSSSSSTTSSNSGKGAPKRNNEDRRRRNREAAQRCRQRRQQLQRDKDRELTTLRVRTKEQDHTITVLRAENRALREQLDLFRRMVERGGDLKAAMASVTPHLPPARSVSSLSDDCVSVRSGSVGTLGSLGTNETEDGASSVDTSSVRMRKRQRRKRTRADSIDESGASSVTSSDSGSDSGSGVTHTMGVTVLALVFAFVVAFAGVDGGPLQALTASSNHVGGAAGGLVDPSLAAMASAAAAGVVRNSPSSAAAADAAADAAGVCLSPQARGRVLQAVEDPTVAAWGYDALVSSSAMLADTALAGNTASAGAGAGVGAGAGDDTVSPAVPHLWSPTAAVTLAVQSLGAQRVAEVLLVNAVLAGFALALYGIGKHVKDRVPALARWCGSAAPAVAASSVAGLAADVGAADNDEELEA